jgi:hypothetical protein
MKDISYEYWKQTTSKLGCKYWVMSTDGWTVFLVLSFAVTDVRELVVGSEYATSKPDSIALHHILVY